MEHYSNLEVAPSQHHSDYDTEQSHKEAIQHPGQQSPQPTPFATQKEVVQSSEHHSQRHLPYETQKEAVKTQEQPSLQAAGLILGEQSAWDGKYYAGRNAETTNGQPVEKLPGRNNDDKRICRLSRRSFIIACVIAAVVIVGAVVGGVAGSLVSRGTTQTSSSGGSSNSTTDTKTNIFINSSLTASNYTDTDGYLHRNIFFQDPYSAIIARQWDSQNQTWKTINLTESLQAYATPVKAAPGTPLAAASVDFASGSNKWTTNIWYLDSENIIRLVGSDDKQSPGTYVPKSLGDVALETWDGSPQLAVTWQRGSCGKCTGWWVMAYQASNGDVNVANYSDWGSPKKVADSTVMPANAAMAIIPYRQDTRVDNVALVYAQIAGTSQSMQLFEYNGSSSWKKADVVLSGLAAPTQFAVTKHNWDSSLYLALLGTGEVSGSWFDGDKFTSLGNMDLSSGPAANFSALAATADSRIYGISDDEIMEYEVDETGSPTLKFVSSIYP